MQIKTGVKVLLSGVVRDTLSEGRVVVAIGGDTITVLESDVLDPAEWGRLNLCAAIEKAPEVHFDVAAISIPPVAEPAKETLLNVAVEDVAAVVAAMPDLENLVVGGTPTDGEDDTPPAFIA